MATWAGPTDFTVGGQAYSTDTHHVSLNQEVEYVNQEVEYVDTTSSTGHHEPKEDWVEQCDHCKYPISHMNIKKVDYGEHVCSVCGNLHETDVEYICPNCDNQVYPQWTYVPPSLFQNKTPSVRSLTMTITPAIELHEDTYSGTWIIPVPVVMAGFEYDAYAFEYDNFYIDEHDIPRPGKTILYLRPPSELCSATHGKYECQFEPGHEQEHVDDRQGPVVFWWEQ